MPSYQAALSAVDQAMPPAHTRMWLIFDTTDVDTAVKTAQQGLGRMVKQLPFLSGEIFEDPDQRFKMTLRWSDENSEVTFEEATGPGLPTCKELAATGFDLENFPIDIQGIDLTGTRPSGPMPVLQTVYVRLEDGLLLLFAPNHVFTDGGGRQMLFELLASYCRDPENTVTKIDPREPLNRAARFTQMNKEAVQKLIDTRQFDDKALQGLVDEHSESRQPPWNPQQIDPPATRANGLLQFSVNQLEALRKAVRKHTKHDFSLNTLVSVLIWTLWTDALARRMKAGIPDLDPSANRTLLGMAVGIRKPYEKLGVMEKGTYVGNIVTQMQPPFQLKFDAASSGSFDICLELAGPGRQGSAPCPQTLPSTIDQITEKLAATSASVLGSTLTGMEAFIESPTTDLVKMRSESLASVFNGSTCVVSNWAAFDFMLDYGPTLGRPVAARIMNNKGCRSGMAVMFPRHRAGDDEALRDHFDVCFTAQKQDFQVMGSSELLQLVLTKMTIT